MLIFFHVVRDSHQAVANTVMNTRIGNYEVLAAV